MLDPASECRWRWSLGAILLVALALRVGAACELQQLLDHRWNRPFLIDGDADGYWRLAQQIANGENYAIYTPPRFVLRMPGFPAVLAVSILAFGPRLFAARLLLAGVGTLACWLTAVLGRRLFDARTGLLAGAATALAPTLIVFSVEPLSETAFAATLLWGLLSAHQTFQLLESPALSWRRLVLVSLLAGIAIAAGVYMRPSWILAGPIAAGLLVALSARRGPALLAGGLLVAGMVLALLPWGIRNHLVAGHFTLTTFWMGPSLYDGLNPHATGDSNMKFYDEDRLMERMSEYEVDQHYRQAAWEFVREHPGQTFHLAGAKLFRFWKPWPNAPQFDHWPARLAVGVLFVPALLLAIWGSWQILAGAVDSLTPRRGIWSVAILAGPILYFAALHMVFVSSLRYRLPAEYPLLILSARGLWDLCDRRRAASGARLEPASPAMSDTAR
jgi:4-amino-4-deoxy-L-arabinose transferase-like glycosyltransferase